MEDKSTSELNPRKLAQLLSLASSDEGDLTPAPLAEEDFLHLLLTRAVHGASDGVGLPPSAGQLLGDPAAKLQAIEKINREAKHLAATSAIDAQRSAATAVYYAAIAHALVYHQKQISKISGAQLIQALADLESRPWISPALRSLYAQARAL